MTLIDEVIGFSRSYINKKSFRTEERKQKIKDALKSLTGERFDFGCSTCYIEALFKIIKIYNMTARNYELKRGVLLQTFGHPEKSCTNNELTDELAEWHLKHNPEKVVLFARLPAPVNQVPPEVVIIQPTKKTEIQPEIKELSVIQETLEGVTEKKPRKARK